MFQLWFPWGYYTHFTLKYQYEMGMISLFWRDIQQKARAGLAPVPAFLRPFQGGRFFKRQAHSDAMASTGQAPAHEPQSIQLPASILYWLSPAEMALTGHSPSQVPQEIHSVLIL
jgi:hypothetical protein